MALTFSRWLSLAALLCGVAAIAILREPKERSSNNDLNDFRRREYRAGAHLSNAAGSLRMLMIVDSLHRSIGRAPSAQSRVFFARNFSPNVKRVLSGLADNAAASRPAQPRVPVDLVFVLDTAHDVRGAAVPGYYGTLKMDYVLPPSTSSGRCMVIARVKEFSNPRMARGEYAGLLGDVARSLLLGPCGYYEWFGMPGPQIDRWLRNGGWDFGLVSAWDVVYPKWQPHWPWYGDVESLLFSDWAVRASTTPRGFGCLAGSIAACDSAVVAGPDPQADLMRNTQLWSSDILSTRFNVDFTEGWYWWRHARAELGPRERTILGEMARTLGPERFRRIWQSSQSFSDAFRAEAGTGVGEWTREWARRLYGDQSRGPRLPALSVLTGILLALVAFGSALATVRRRQVA